MLIGTLASAGSGAVMPVFAFLFGEMLGALSQPADKARADSVFYAVIFVVFGILAGLAMFLQSIMFAVSGKQSSAAFALLSSGSYSLPVKKNQH